MSNVQPNERVVDLGSGDGKILFAFAQRGAECHGFEVNPILILISKVRVFFSKTNGKIHIHPKNFWKEDLSTYDIIIIYGLSNVMARLERKLPNQKGKSNMKVISNVFTFPNLEYTEKRGEVYLYII
jgi:16S rRNA A1518/A1519 N6-dimethyltransferase RsmA/KsgA/DIM1 with predicted DNA glycosylase/AP lyase activity